MAKLVPEYFECSRAYLVGVKDYSISSWNLFSPLNDIDDLSEALKQHEFDPPNIIRVPNATKNDLINLLKKMKTEIGARDRVLFYFAGHGIARESDEEPRGFLVPADAQRSESSLIDMKWLMGQFAELSSKHFLLILDCCFAGSIRWAESMRDIGLDLTKKIYFEKFNRFVSDETKAWQVITSSSYDEAARDQLLRLGKRDNDSLPGRNSPFATLLINLLNNKENCCTTFEDGIITTTRLYDYLDSGLQKIIDETNDTKAQSPSYFPLKKHLKGQFIFLSPAFNGNPVKALQPSPQSNPYKGLASYQFTDAHLFFGRRKVIRDAKEILLNNDTKILLVSGTSGVGKSSLVMAGLIPSVNESFPGEPIMFRPGDSITRKGFLDQLKLSATLRTDPFLLMIDQYEEVITVCDKPGAEAINTLILSVLENKVNKVIICLRSDFESQFKDDFIFKQSWTKRFVVPPFQRSEIAEIILQPASQSEIAIESEERNEAGDDSFIDEIVDEAMQSPGSLPLLSFTLETWYERSVKANSRWVLREKVYKDIGGVSGSLSSIITDFSKSLTVKENDCLKLLLLKMVKVVGNQYARKRVTVSELSFTKAEDSAIIDDLLKRLVNLRVIASGGQPGEERYFEPAHDSLLTSWKQLWEWINLKGHGKMAVYNELADDTRDWIMNNRRSDYLWGNRVELDVARKEFEEQLPKERSFRKKLDFAISVFTLGRRPRIKESGNHLFNRDESAFMKKSIVKARNSRGLPYRILTVVMIALVAVGILSFNVWRQSIKNKALYLLSESEKYGGVEKIAMLKSSYALYPDTGAVNRMYTFINSNEYFDPVPIAQHTSGNSIDTAYFDSDTTVVFEYTEGSNMRWSFTEDQTAEKDEPLKHPLLVFNDSTGVIVSRKGNKQFKPLVLKDRKLEDYEVSKGNVAVISSLRGSFYINYIDTNGANIEIFTDNALADGEIPYLTNNELPHFTNNRRYVYYQEGDQGVISDLKGHIIRDDVNRMVNRLDDVYVKDTAVFEFHSFFIQDESKLFFDYGYYKKEKPFKRIIVEDPAFFFPPSVYTFQLSDTAYILAITYVGNEGSDPDNGQSTRVYKINHINGKLDTLLHETKEYISIIRVNDSTLLLSDEQSVTKVLNINSGRLHTLTTNFVKRSVLNGGMLYSFVTFLPNGHRMITIYDSVLRPVFFTQHSLMPQQIVVSSGGSRLLILFPGNNAYVWKLNNYFDNMENAITDPTSRGNFHIEENEFMVSDDGEHISILGRVQSGGGGITVDYTGTPGKDSSAASFFKTYKPAYTFKSIFKENYSKEELNESFAVDSLMKIVAAKSETIVRASFMYPNYFLSIAGSNLFIIKRPVGSPPKIIQQFQYPLRIENARLYDNGNKIILVLENGTIHKLWTSDNFKNYFKKIKIKASGD